MVETQKGRGRARASVGTDHIVPNAPINRLNGSDQISRMIYFYELITVPLYLNPDSPANNELKRFGGDRASIKISRQDSSKEFVRLPWFSPAGFIHVVDRVVQYAWELGHAPGECLRL
jgi:hypothetical protein